MASLKALPVLCLDSPMMRGPIVLSLQMRLNRLLKGRLQPELQIEEDGIFGVNTWDGVKAFQKLEGIEQTGVVTLQVWAKLLER